MLWRNEAEEILTTEKENIVPIELGVKKNTHSIFFAPENEGKDFSSVLKEVQEYISENYAQLITDSSLEDAKGADETLHLQICYGKANGCQGYVRQ